MDTHKLTIKKIVQIIKNSVAIILSIIPESSAIFVEASSITKIPKMVIRF